jgi:hypothetical protein
MTTLQIFNELDIHDDKVMLELAVFLHRLVVSFPENSGQAPPPPGQDIR